LKNLDQTEKIILFSLSTLFIKKQFMGVYRLLDENLSENHSIITLFEFSDDTWFPFPLTKSNNGRGQEKILY
jgi:hypothetical protein